MPKPATTTTTYELPGGVSLSLTTDDSKSLTSVCVDTEVDPDTHRAAVTYHDDDLAELMDVMALAVRAWRRHKRESAVGGET